MIRFLLDGARANHERFAFLTVKLRWLRYARARTFEDALAGKWLDDPAPAVAHITWAYSNGRYSSDAKYDAETLRRFEKRDEKGRVVYRSLWNNRCVWNRAVEFSVETDIVQSIAPASYHYGFSLFGCGKFFPMYELPARYGGSFEYVGVEKWDKRRLSVLRLRSPRGQIDEFWIDPARGFIPIRLITRLVDSHRNPPVELLQIQEVFEVREVGSGRWLPTRIRYGSHRQPFVPGYEVIVDEIDADHPPPEELFEIRLKPGARAFDRFHTGWIKTHTGRLSLANFRSDGTLVPGQTELEWQPPNPPSSGSTVRLADDAAAAVPQLPFAPRRPWQSMRFWQIVGVIVAVLAGVAAIVLRRLKASRVD
jgi:hypothetical protein